MSEEYWKKYQLREDPFTPDPDPRYTYLSCSFHNVLFKAEYAIDHNMGPVVTYGGYGMGKTILARILWQRYTDKPASHAVLMGCKDFTSPNRFLRTIIQEFRIGKTAKAMEDSYSILINFLKKEVKAKKKQVLILDNAELLSRDDLDFLARLNNEFEGTIKLIHLVLFGQFSLHENALQVPDFSKDIAFYSYQESLSFEEMIDMLHFQWHIAGGRQELPFEPNALHSIYQKSLGNPMDINKSAAAALQNANGKSVKKEDVEN